jgi:hypothetical protein
VKNRVAALAAALLAAGPLRSSAQQPSPEPAPQQGPPTRAAPPEATAPAPAPDDFELLPPEKAPDAEQLAREQRIQSSLHTRRSMLQLHQIAGLATVAAMGTTVVLGQLNYDDKYGGGGDTGRYKSAHSIAAYSTAGIFAAGGLLALFAPSPFDKPVRLDTATLHKVSMAVATAGMVTQIVLGIATGGREGTIAQRDLALAHQIVGYTTFAATAAGFTVLLF